MTESDIGDQPLGAPRVTLIDNVIRLPESDVAEARSLYLAGYPDTKYWVDFDDFSCYRMDVLDIYYVGRFGVMGWLAEYFQAQPDPLIDNSSDIIQHMNHDHKDALILLAKHFANVEAQDAEMTSVDRLGFHLHLKANDGVRGVRIAFLREVGDPSQTREVIVEMGRLARQV